MSDLFNEIEPDSGPNPPMPLPTETPAAIALDYVPAEPSVWRRRIKLVSHFFMGQAIVQAIGFLIGFLLLRWMDVATYAQYSVAWAFQSTAGSLVDLGFTASIIALVGEHADKPEIVGKYIRTARYFRIRSFFIVLVGATALYPVAVWNQPWGWHVKLLLYIGMLGGLLAQNLVMYASALLIARELKPYYRAQIAAGLWRQAAYAIMYLTNTLTSWAASWVSAVSMAIYGFLYRRSAKKLIVEPLKADPAANREMLRYIGPLIPGAIFFAMQGQITVGMITIFGKTRNIAEVSALGRLNQLFLILSVFNNVIVEPYMARSSRDRLARRYLQVLTSQIVVACGMVLIAIMFPGVLLWLLGPKYSNLSMQIKWVVISASIEYIAMGMSVMNNSRKWNYWWGTAFYIATILLTQSVSLAMFDMTSTVGVIYFDIASNVGMTLVVIIISIYGFQKGPPRGLSDSPTTVALS